MGDFKFRIKDVASIKQGEDVEEKLQSMFNNVAEKHGHTPETGKPELDRMIEYDEMKENDEDEDF